jgi:hypothetical protein
MRAPKRRVAIGSIELQSTTVLPAAVHQGLRHLAARLHEQQVARGQQVAGHGRAHDAQADEADLQSGPGHALTSFSQPRPSSVLPRGLYSQPM